MMPATVMAKKPGGKSFAAPAQKYAGQVKIDAGPVPIQRWRSPYYRADRDRLLGAEGVDLRGERMEKQTAPPPHTRKHPDDNSY